MAESKGGVSRRGFVKYVVGIAAAVAAAVAGYVLFSRRQEQATLPEGYADMVLMNGKILTVDPKDSVVDAVAVKDGKIFATGSYRQLKQLVGPSTMQVDLKGKTVTPGLVDSHLHVYAYGKQFQDRLIDVRFPEVKTREEVIERIKKKVETTPQGEWVASNQGFIFPDPPDRWELDRLAPDNPVYLVHASGQFAVANSRALALAGIGKDTPNPYGAVIAKDASTGEPTGFLYHYPAIDMVRRLVPGIGMATEEEEKEFIITGARKCLELGYTTCQDVIVPLPRHVMMYGELAQEDRLPINAYMLLYVESLEDAKTKLGIVDHGPRKGKNYNFAGWKIAVDGGSSAGTSLMYDTSVPAAEKSYLFHTQDALNEMVAMFNKEGYQVAFHVSGDRAIDMALDAIEYALEKTPRTDHRHRLEHALFPTPEALERIKRLGVVVSTQPQWISILGRWWKETVTEEQMNRFMPLKTMLEKGIPLAFGCDAPATPLIEPKYAFGGATTRMMMIEETPLQPKSECISMKDALRAHTMGSAYASFEENTRGSLEPGKIADMVVWSENLYSVSLKELLNIRVEATIVEGQVVYKAQDTEVGF